MSLLAVSKGPTRNCENPERRESGKTARSTGRLAQSNSCLSVGFRVFARFRAFAVPCRSPSEAAGPGGFQPMHSILFHIGPLPIYSYGFMLMLAFLAATGVAARLGRQRGIQPESIFDLTAFILVSAVIGARMLYVALQWSYFRDQPAHIVRLGEGGLSFHGGLMVGLLAGLVFARRR